MISRILFSIALPLLLITGALGGARITWLLDLRPKRMQSIGSQRRYKEILIIEILSLIFFCAIYSGIQLRMSSILTWENNIVMVAFIGLLGFMLTLVRFMGYKKYKDQKPKDRFLEFAQACISSLLTILLALVVIL